MSVVKKAAKTSLVIFSTLVALFVIGGVYLYMNVSGISKELSEQVATDALGVAVTIGEMDVSVADKLIVVRNLKIANPGGYVKDNAIEVGKITITANSFSKTLVHLKDVRVEGTNVFLEVRPKGTNLGDIKKNIDAKQSAKKSGAVEPQAVDDKHARHLNVMIDDFILFDASIYPSVTLMDKDLGKVVMPDLALKNIGHETNGVKPKDAIRTIVEALLVEMNKSANKARFLEGLSLESVNEMGVNTMEVFQKNLKKSYEDEVDNFKKGFESLKKAFE